MSSHSPSLSVIVPTRDRADTLVHTLATLLDQPFEDCEILVSDNASLDDTRNAVLSLSDSRLRYINTGRRMSMAENWEFALGEARGEYITYIGDDDGFLPDALAKAMSLLRQSGLRALVWDKIDYCWPDYIDDELKNWFSFRNRRYSLRVVDGRRKLRQVMKFIEGYNRLPCLYNGIIQRSLLEEVKAQSRNGVFFNSITPDVYSGISLSMVVGSYLYTDYPFSMNGASRHSNGTSFFRQRTTGEDTPHTRFLVENTRQYHAAIRMAPSPSSCVMGEYLLAREHLPELRFDEPDWHHYIRSLVKDAHRLFLRDDILASARHTRGHLGLRVQIPDFIQVPQAHIAANPGFRGETFNFIAPSDMVANIRDACRLAGGMLPDLTQLQKGSPFRLFARRLAECLLIEAKVLYRSL